MADSIVKKAVKWKFNIFHSFAISSAIYLSDVGEVIILRVATFVGSGRWGKLSESIHRTSQQLERTSGFGRTVNDAGSLACNCLFGDSVQEIVNKFLEG